MQMHLESETDGSFFSYRLSTISFIIVNIIVFSTIRVHILNFDRHTGLLRGVF